jgi:radical SAM enzyme (TIGR01210 family)
MTLSASDPIRVMKAIRALYDSDSLPSWDPKKCCVYFEESIFESKPYFLPIVVLKTNPCSWLTRGGGCLMCDYQRVAALRGRQITESDILDQAEWALKWLRPDQRFPYVHIASSGSTLDPEEMSDKVLVGILKMAEQAGVKTFGIETRPEYLLNKDRLNLFRDNFRGKIAIGIGLESSDEFIRHYCINKGFITDVFDKAVKVVNERGLEFFSYVMLGKPFLTVKEDVEDAVRSIRYSLSKGGLALLMVANLQPNTLSHWLWKRRMYNVPSLWAAVRVLELLSHEERQKVAVKAFDKAVPMPLRFATNCERCTSTVHNALVGFDFTGDFSLLESVRDCCGCKTNWEAEYEFEPSLPTYERIADKYEYILKELNIDGN